MDKTLTSFLWTKMEMNKAKVSFIWIKRRKLE